MKYPQSWGFVDEIWKRKDVKGKERRRTRQSFRPVFQRTGFALFERVGSERAASASYAHGRRADAQNAFHFEGRGGEGERRERRVGRCEWSKKASAEYNNYFTSDLRGPGNWNFRATPGTKAAGSGAPLPTSLLARAVQNIFNYGIIICCLCRGECAPLLPAQIILI